MPSTRTGKPPLILHRFPEPTDIRPRHRVLLFSSFTPFLVVFLQAIATGDSELLNLLQKVIESLKFTARASKAADRLYRVCSAFGEVAKAMFETGRLGGSGEEIDQMRSAGGTPHLEDLDLTCQGLFADAGLNGLANLNDEDLSSMLDDWGTGVSIMDLLGAGAE